MDDIRCQRLREYYYLLVKIEIFIQSTESIFILVYSICREIVFYIFYKNQLFKMANIMIREILWFKIFFFFFNESIHKFQMCMIFG